MKTYELRVAFNFHVTDFHIVRRFGRRVSPAGKAKAGGEGNESEIVNVLSSERGC
jgi:hypothetical protein